MKKLKIYLNSFDKIKDFIDVTNRLDYKLNLISESFIIDGKSIMGILNLDLTKPIDVNIICEKQDEYICPKELEAFIFV